MNLIYSVNLIELNFLALQLSYMYQNQKLKTNCIKITN